MSATKTTVRIHKLPIDQSVKDAAPERAHVRNLDHGWGIEVDGKIADVGPHSGLFSSTKAARGHYLKKMQPEDQTTEFEVVGYRSPPAS